MLHLDPDIVTLTIAGAPFPLPGVTAIAIDRRAARLVVEYGDAGPHPAFVDAPEQIATIRVRRDVHPGEATFPDLRPGALVGFFARLAPSAGDASVRTIAAQAVVRAIEHDLTPRKSAEQIISLVAVSTTGGADPIVEEAL